ncbi:hypothetical protein PROFUN_01715 [Planoprotostelium fungivorum]|uniref:PH domain-containing protein n=1 Tax=Planoprotostelium fungivorum TaxID=1890364 RepID=A0A2P6MWB7_9EUKA|nr:hypothetical protein PROFUN_01715 [Planoprotostelium fungivorum]
MDAPKPLSLICYHKLSHLGLTSHPLAFLEGTIVARSTSTRTIARLRYRFSCMLSLQTAVKAYKATVSNNNFDLADDGMTPREASDAIKYLFAGAEQSVTVYKEFSMKLLASRPNITMSFFPWQQSMNQILNVSYLPSGAAKLGIPEAVIEKQKEDLLIKKITSDVEEGRINLVDFAYALRYDSHVNKHLPVKKGHMTTEDGIIFKDWKNIWLVLKEDGIYFYHKETNRTPYKIINQRSFKELQVDPKNNLSFFLKTFNDGVIHFRTCEWFISNKTWILRHNSHTRTNGPVDAHHLVFHLSGNLGRHQ